MILGKLRVPFVWAPMTLRRLLGSLCLCLAALLPSAAVTAPVRLDLDPAQQAWVAQHPVIRIQMSDQSPPFEYRDQGQPNGIAYRYLLEASRRLGLTVQVTEVGWTEALRSIASDHKVDLILCVSPSPERERTMLFTRTYLSFPQVIFTERRHGFVSHLADLSQSRISVERDYLMEQWLRRDLPLARLHVTDGPRQALQALSNGQVEAYVGNLATATFLIDQMGLVNLEVAAPSGYPADDFSMGIRKDWPELKDLLDKAFASLTPEDERAFREPWLAVRYEYGLRPWDIVKWVLLVALIALAFILQLRSMVKRRTAELKAQVELRKTREHELEQSLKGQQDLHRQLSDIIDLLPDATVVIDQDHRVVAWNRAMVKMTGVPAREMIGKGDYAYAVPFYGRPQPTLADLLFDREPQPLRAYETFTRDGNVISAQAFVPALNQGQGAHLFATAAPLTDGQGKVVGAIETVRDITEQQRSAEQRAQAQRLQAIGTLAGGIAHDFNNILAAILGNTELALAQQPPTPVQGALEVVLRASRRAVELVKQILAFSRTTPEPARPVQLRSVAEEALKLLRASIPSSIKLESDLASEARVMADPGDIHRLLVNLCTNAAFAMAEHGGTLTVSLRELPWAEVNAALPGLPAGNYACLSVRDSGVGMSAEVQSHLFEPFFSTRKDSGGSGMGLAVVHGLVVSLGGGIRVQSAPGQGSIFFVYLPLAAPDAAGPPPAPNEALRGDARVLFVDDEPMIVDVTQRALSLLGYRVNGQTDPRQALRVFEADPGAFDVVVTDLTMPGMNGRQLTARLKELRPGMPVILCTGFNEGYEDLADQDKDDGFLQKPASLAELTQAIRRALAKN